MLALGGTPKTERGQHHNPTWNRVQPCEELKLFVLPVVQEWADVLKDSKHPKWAEPGARKTSCAVSFNKVILSIYRNLICFANKKSLIRACGICGSLQFYRG